MSTPTEPLSLLILAGGKSTRLSQDKVWLELDGQPLVERAARRLLPLAREIIFSGQPSPRFDALIASLPVLARIVPDLYRGAGPLAGLHAGLLASQHDLVLALATDMPFVNVALVRYLVGLAAGVDAVVPQVHSAETGGLELNPLHALYRRACLPAIEACLANGRRRMTAFLADVAVRYVSPDDIKVYDPEFRSFANINTPQDWAQARDGR